MNYHPDWDRVTVAGGRKIVYCPDHPNAWKSGYVQVHRIVAEQKLGRLLLPTEIVHHRDENDFNNSPDNLVVTESHSTHGKIHGSIRTERSLVTLHCATCGGEIRRLRSRSPKARNYKRAFCNARCAGQTTGFQKGISIRYGAFSIRHGTAVAYNYHKCRCDLCRAFKAKEARDRRKALKSR